MVPMFFAGSFLGVLVIFGQGSKEGGRAVLTAVLLLLDVLFKIGATLCNECVSYGRAARRRGRARRADSMPTPEVATTRRPSIWPTWPTPSVEVNGSCRTG